ncbi:hypothetical protein D3C85_1779920 [compost metagenome]
MAPDHPVDVEDAAQHDKRQRLLRRIGGDKLRYKGEEEERDLGVEYIGQQALPKDPPIGERRQRNCGLTRNR